MGIKGLHRNRVDSDGEKMENEMEWRVTKGLIGLI